MHAPVVKSGLKGGASREIDGHGVGRSVASDSRDESGFLEVDCGDVWKRREKHYENGIIFIILHGEGGKEEVEWMSYRRWTGGRRRDGGEEGRSERRRCGGKGRRGKGVMCGEKNGWGAGMGVDGSRRRGVNMNGREGGEGGARDGGHCQDRNRRWRVEMIGKE
jgi:hypothetical protein